MTTIAHRAAVIDRLLAQWGLHNGDVIATHVYATDVVVYLRAPLDQLEWIVTPRADMITYRHKLTAEEMDVTLIAGIETEAVA